MIARRLHGDRGPRVFGVPLVTGGADAAFVVTLPPGGYTVLGFNTITVAIGVLLAEPSAVP